MESTLGGRFSLNLLSSNGAFCGRNSGKFPCGLWDGRIGGGCCSAVPVNKRWRRGFCVSALPEHSESLPEPPKSSWMHGYHPSEEIREPLLMEDGHGARLTDAETARTMVEVNSKAALMFTELIGDIGQRCVWFDMPYLTDEHGDIYFGVANKDDSLKNFFFRDTEETLVQAFIGVDNIEVLAEIETSAPCELDFDFVELSSDDDELEYDSEVEDAIFEEEEEVYESSESHDWSHAETMHATHPLHFAKKIAEAVSHFKLDWMDQPSTNVIIQGLLRPVFVDEHKLCKKHPRTVYTEINGGFDNDQSLQSGITFFKLEIIGIQLVSAFDNQSQVKVQDFHESRPDVIAHSAANILSRLRAGGDKTIQALKGLCWRHKGVHVEEVSIIGLDSLGFDLRVCSGTQIQTIRFPFNSRATSEFSAEQKVRELLFPRFNRKLKRWQAAQRKEL